MPSGKQRVLFTLLLVLATLSLAHFAWASYNTLRIGFADIDVFLYRLWIFLAKGELYLRSDDLQVAYEAGRSVLKFPPIYELPYLPWLDATHGFNHVIYKVLFALHVMRYLLTLLLCGYFLGPRNNAMWWMVLVVVFSLCAPFQEALYGLTFDNLFLFVLVAALVLMKFRQRALPVLLMTYAASAKIYPALQLLPWILDRQRRAVPMVVAGLLLWSAISLVFFGWTEHEFYFFHILPVLLREQTLCETGNLSLAALMCSHTTLFGAMKLLFLVASCAVTLSALRRLPPSFERDGFIFALFVCLPLLMMQNMWGNYQIILLVPVCLLLSYSFCHRGHLVFLPGLFALLAWFPLLVSDNYPAMKLAYYTAINDKIVRFMIDDLKPFSALLLWLVLAVLLLRKDDLSVTS